MILDDTLARLVAAGPSEVRDAFVGFVSARGDAALRRDGGPEHVTASCFVFSPDLSSTLLCFHRKGGFWVQFGGHIEADDATIVATAQREAREESGIDDLEVTSDLIVDLERHELHGRFACTAHWDISFVAVVDPDAVVTVSDESLDVRWFPIHDLPSDVAPGLGTRLARARDALTRE
ncbi:NUDIX domain-containing protein [Planctomonas sp. JC2975]|uniref:NUDIX hydrolase n=1 Tax=Planctomonas sp. JC2975 TaxID=2729626 RepID=UPI00147403E3|nr:NUDIX domain-containing protein [Planctomonas sp. JC2975]NNC11452.1 NUDIX domain-containing protein [Planctomonas sp. JC2975]